MQHFYEIVLVDRFPLLQVCLPGRLSWQAWTNKHLVEASLHTLLVVWVIPMKMRHPKGSDALQLLLVEDAHAVWWPEQAVPHHHVWKILEALLLAQPLLEWMLKRMSGDLDHWAKLLELPRLKLVDDSEEELAEEVEEGELTVVWSDCCEFRGVGLEDKPDVVLVELSPCGDLGVYFLSTGAYTSVSFLSPKNASPNFFVISYINKFGSSSSIFRF